MTNNEPKKSAVEQVKLWLEHGSDRNECKVSLITLARLHDELAERVQALESRFNVHNHVQADDVPNFHDHCQSRFCETPAPVQSKVRASSLAPAEQVVELDQESFDELNRDWQQHPQAFYKSSYMKRDSITIGNVTFVRAAKEDK